MHPTLAEGVDDMINLGEMSEAGLLRNLMLRHKRGLVYVRTHKRPQTAEKIASQKPPGQLLKS